MTYGINRPKQQIFIYFIDYQLWQPDSMIEDNMMGYNINNNNI